MDNFQNDRIFISLHPKYFPTLKLSISTNFKTSNAKKLKKIYLIELKINAQNNDNKTQIWLLRESRAHDTIY